jgi:hypothetical protein
LVLSSDGGIQVTVAGWPKLSLVPGGVRPPDAAEPPAELELAEELAGAADELAGAADVLLAGGALLDELVAEGELPPPQAASPRASPAAPMHAVAQRGFI